MLVLTRKVNERITITVPPSVRETKIEVILTDVRGDKCRIGFEAARDVAIIRDDALQQGRD